MNFKKLISLLILILTASLILSLDLTDKSNSRIHYSINKNVWKFKKADVQNGFSETLNDKDWLNVTIPHDFNGGIDGVNNDVFKGRFDFKNDLDKREMYKGTAWYRTEITIDKKQKGKKIFIEFEAVSLQANIWVNGKEVGEHKGGYTSFSFDITDYLKFDKPNILALRVDNSNNPQIAPWMKDEKKAFPFSFDYAIYGGIYRDVWITITDPIKIEKVFNTPVCGGQAPASLSIDTKVKNNSDIAQEVTLISEIFNPQNEKISTLKTTKEIKSGEEIKFSQFESDFNGVEYWSTESPKLYKVNSNISYNGKIVDNFESIFGFRYYTFANNQAFSLNGKKQIIRGVNRHQDMQGLGYALPNEQHFADAKMIKDAGFNFVRHAHYPCDPAFAKACNELGLMLWLEIPLTGSTSDDPAFAENCKTQMTEMIEQNYNNPAVVVWGIGNESDRSGAAESISNKLFTELVKQAKSLDENRPVTGCNFKYKSNQKIVEVYSPQDWSGWYSGTISEYNPTSIIGEYGSDMDYNIHSNEIFDASKDYQAAQKTNFWSQEYGCFLHEYKVSYGESINDKFPGHNVWVAFDFASPRADRGKNPVPYMNQKGLVLHDHKTKKDVYYFYQSMYRRVEDFPMVYIVSHSWKDRWTKPEAKDIWVYSNCDSVELFNDYLSLSLGKRTKDSGPLGNTRFQWNAAYVKYNVLYAEGWYNNEIVVRDTLVLNNLPIKN